MTIRHAQPADWPEIVRIYNDTIPTRQVTADIEPVSIESRQAWLESHSPAQYPLWVKTEQDQIRGWLSFSPFYGRPAYRKTAEVSLYVDAANRKLGIGSLLLQNALDTAPDLGFQHLLGFIFAHNEPSIRLFTRHGFVQRGYLPGVAELDDRSVDLVILDYSTQTPPR